MSNNTSSYIEQQMEMAAQDLVQCREKLVKAQTEADAAKYKLIDKFLELYQCMTEEPDRHKVIRDLATALGQK